MMHRFADRADTSRSRPSREAGSACRAERDSCAWRHPRKVSRAYAER
jgi:hypothetical protein